VAITIRPINEYAITRASDSPHFTWAATTTDTRALQNGANTGRLAATWFSGSSFNFDVNVTDGSTHQFGLYAIDWDNGGRAESIQIADASTLAVLDTRSVSTFTNRTYLFWNISGHVKVTVTRTSGPSRESRRELVLAARFLAPFVFALGAAALWHANAIERAARPPFVLSGVPLTGIALCAAYPIWCAFHGSTGTSRSVGNS
jgi:hypothetical protein